jgi:hypothetical protein
MRRLQTLIIIFLALFNTTRATILTVKQDGTGNYTTIQSAINAASTGDTVLVWPGIYYENINYNSKRITVASLNLTTGDPVYINSTIIDGNSNGSCVMIDFVAAPAASLVGFSIINGSGHSTYNIGGGIYVYEAHITIRNCVIKHCSAWSGGGIAGLIYSTIYLSGTRIYNNKAMHNGGGIAIGGETTIVFDPVNLNSVFLNHGTMGCDISKGLSPPLHIILDTATVLNPANYFFAANNSLGYPVYDLTWEFNHSIIQQVSADLYVNPGGSNYNSGLSPDSPLQTIEYALKKILPDTVSPKSIYLTPGIYSPSSNQELFPIVPRSYVSLQGSGSENTIVDAEHTARLIYSHFLTNYWNITGIKFMRGDTYKFGMGGMNFLGNDEIKLTDISISETKGYARSGITSNLSKIILNRVSVFDNSGGYPLVLGNTGQTPKDLLVYNSVIQNNGPAPSYDDGWGGAVGIHGSLSYPTATYGRLVNVQITENMLLFEPGAGSKAICGLSSERHARVDLVNTTFGNNEIVNPVDNAQVIAQEGAKINFYNTIIHGVEDYEIFLGDGQPTSYISTINISHSNVKGGESNIQNWNNIHNLNWLSGNIADDPLWSGSEPHYYDLLEGSPSINTGTPMYEPGMDYPFIKTEGGKHILYTLTGDTIHLPATDLAGNPRISGGRIDMGAYEFQETTTNHNPYGQTPKHGFRVHPNPFVSNAFISFKTAREHQVTIDVINMKGETMRTIASNRFPTGEYRLIFDGHDDAGFVLDPGTYLVCLYLDGMLAGAEKLVRAKR